MINVLCTLDLSQAANTTIHAAGALNENQSTVTRFTVSRPAASYGLAGSPRRFSSSASRGMPSLRACL